MIRTKGVLHGLLALLLLASSASGAQLLVARDGSSDYRTITSAMNEARFGDTIFVAPGVYAEGVDFKNGVTLIGSGAGSTVVQYGYGFDPVLDVSHVSSGRIEGLTFERTERTLAAPTLRLDAASIEIVSCSVLGGLSAGLEVSAPTSALVLQDVEIRGSSGHGLWIHGGARVTARHCRIEENGEHGILITEDAVFEGDSIQIRGNAGHGLAMDDATHAVLHAVDLLDHAGWGLHLREESQAHLTASRLDGNALGALRLADSSSALVERSSLDGGAHAVHLTDGTDLELSDTSITGANDEAVYVEGRGRLRIERTHLTNAGGHAMVFASTSTLTLSHVNLVGNAGSGVVVESGTATIDHSIIAYNGGEGISVLPAASTQADHNTLWGNGGSDFAGLIRRTSNLLEPPGFVNPTEGDLRLRPDSPCIGAGRHWETIGATGDPRERPGTRGDLRATVGVLPGLDLYGQIREDLRPSALQEILLGLAYTSPRAEVDITSSFGGTWGTRTTASGRVQLLAAETPSALLAADLDVDAVLDGIASRVYGRCSASLTGTHWQLMTNVSRTFPTGPWIVRANATLGYRTTFAVGARAVDLAPDQLSAHLEHTDHSTSGTTSLRAGLLLGQTGEATFHLLATRPLLTLAVHAGLALDDLSTIRSQLSLSQPSDGVQADLSLRRVHGAFEDAALRISKDIGRARFAVELGVGAARGPRLALHGEVRLADLARARTNELPIARFETAPETPQASEPVVFDASSSEDPDGQIVDYWWDFGDGAVELGERVDHTYSDAGDYTVLLSVVDAAGATTSFERLLTVRPAETAPVAAFTWEPINDEGTRLPRPLREGDSIRLDASASRDPEGGTLSYQWDFESDGQFDRETSDPVLVLPPLEPGSHPITLRVIKEDGRVDAILHALLVAAAKPPSADFALSPDRPSILDPIRFLDRSTDPDGRIVAWEWSFGEGTSSRLSEPVHRFDTPGTYRVELRVTDEDGLTDLHTAEIEVASHPEILPVDGFWLIAIGISDYADVPDLAFARDDALAMVEWALETGVPADHVRLLTDPHGLRESPDTVEAREATLVNVRDALGWVRRMAKPNDLVVIHFSGHGYQGLDDGDDERDGVDEFFVLLDTIGHSVDDTALRDDEFGRFLDRLESDRVLVLFDGCHSGGLSRSLPSGHRPTTDTPDRFRDFSLQGRLILSAAGEAEDAFESPALGHGVFTHFVLAGLRGAADMNEDARVTAWELYEYVLAEVPAFVRAERGADQVPQIVGEGDTRVVVSTPHPPPSANIAFSPTVPFVGAAVRFSSSKMEGEAFRLWSFGDGRFSTRTDPTHVYAQSGSYTVDLVVRAPSGALAKARGSVLVVPNGRVLEVDGGAIISLGRQNGLEIGDRFAVEGAATGVRYAELEVVEWIGADLARCRVRRTDGPLTIGDLLHRVTDAPEVD